MKHTDPKIPDFGLFFERVKNADAFDLPHFAIFIELMIAILPSTAQKSIQSKIVIKSKGFSKARHTQ